MIPVYLRWYTIAAVWLFWPGWYPVGPLVALGLWLIRMRALPAQRHTLGWCIAASTAPFAMLAGWFYQHGSMLLRPAFGGLLLVSLLAVLFGVALALLSRGRARIIDLVDRKGLRSADEIAKALGRRGSVTSSLHRLAKSGWLEGYEFDRATGRIDYVGVPEEFGEVVTSSWLGLACVLLGLLTFGVFWMASPTGAIRTQLQSMVTAVAAEWEQLFPSNVRACEAVPATDLSRILGTKFLRAESTHRKGWSRCVYLVWDKPRETDRGERYWIELDYQPPPMPPPAAPPPPPPGILDQARALLGSVIDKALTDGSRAQTIQQQLGQGYEVRDYRYKQIDVRKGNVAVSMQASGLQDLLDLVRPARESTPQPDAKAYAAIAKQALERAR